MTQPDKLYELKIPYNKSVEELVQMTKDNPPICWTAYLALGYNRTDKSIYALKSLLTNPDWTHVRSAIEAIGKNINGIDLEESLFSFLDDTNKFIVIATIRTLSNLKSEKAHDKIKKLIAFDNLEIKNAAIEGISHLWQSTDFSFLLTHAKLATNDSVKKNIGFVLAQHVDKNNWKIFFDHYNQDNISRHREWSLTFANTFSGDKTIVQSFLNDKDGHIRKKAKLYIETSSSA
jgi:hypothetical protein